MKYFLFLLPVVLLVLSCHKEADYQQVQQNMLQSHRWILDSVYINDNGNFRVDTLQSPDYTRVEYSSLTYSVFNSVNSIQSDTMLSYQFNARDSRIYYWPLNRQKDNEVYHNIQNLSDTRFVFADYIPGGAGSLLSYVYFFHAQ